MAKKKKKSKFKSFVKSIFILFGMLIIGLGAFIFTIKMINPNYDLLLLVPDSVETYVKEDVLGITTTTTTTTTRRTTTTTTIKYQDYEDSSEFDFESGAQGNNLGNILGENTGKVCIDSSYIYHIVDGKGIYRFAPSSETYSLYYKTTDKLTSLNLRGDYLYFVNNSDNNLYRLQKGSSKAENIATNVKFAYVYDETVYYVTNNNKVCVMNTEDLESKIIYYTSDENEVTFVGISLNRVYFTVYNSVDTVEYVVIDNDGKNKGYFRVSTNDTDIVNMQLENGYFYYYELQDDGSYDLIRQKFGSEKTVTLVSDSTTTDYVIVDKNKVFYKEFKDSNLKLKELNMNSNDVKTMVTVKDVNSSSEYIIQHGGEYDFIIGDDIYRASSMYTSSNNVMNFKSSKWSY